MKKFSMEVIYMKHLVRLQPTQPIKAGDRLLQFLVVPVANVNLSLVDELSPSARGAGGFGSTGK